METTITIRGRRGQIIFFDDEDRGTMTWALSLLPHHMRNDLRTYERMGKANRFEFAPGSVTIHVDLWESSADEVAKLICLIYDSYFRHKYNRAGKQTEYEIKRD